MIESIHPHEGLQRALLIAHLVMSLLVIGRLMFYRKKHARHKVHMSFVAYFLLVAYGWTAIRILTGEYLSPVDWSDLAVNAAVLVAVFCAKGNIARFLMASSTWSAKAGAHFPSPRSASTPRENE